MTGPWWPFVLGLALYSIVLFVFLTLVIRDF